MKDFIFLLKRGSSLEVGSGMARERDGITSVTLWQFTAALFLMLTVGVGQMWAANIVIDLDFTVASTYTSSGFPTSETNPKTTSGTYTFGGYSFGFQCATSMYRNSTGSGQNIKYYILIGKSGGIESNASIITFPAISNYKLTEVELTVATSSGENVQAYIGSSYGTTLTGGTAWVFVKTDGSNTNTWSLSGTSTNTSYKMYIVKKDGTNNTYNGQIAGLKLTYEPAASCADPAAPRNSSNTSSSLTLATTSTSANYDFYCSTTNSTSGATALTIQSVTGGQSKTYTGLNYGTTYYYWIRKDCGGGSTSSWVAGASTATTAAPNTGLSISAGSLKPTKATFTIGDSNSPKINTYGGTYDIYYSTSDDTPTGSTVASRNESTLSWTATGLTAGTKYYYWVRGHGANANSSWVSGGNFTTPTLSSITVKTEPTTTTYFAGQTFSPTGLVITANYSNSSTDDVAYSGNEGSFSFSPTTATALTTSDAAVTITYGGKTVDQPINVYSVTVNKVDEDGATVSADGVTASWTVGTKALAASATAGSKYVFKEWAFDGSNNGLSITSTSSANTTVTGTPIGNVTIKAVFYKPRVVKWSVNGNDSYNTGSPTGTIAYHKEWSDLKLPSDPTPPCGDKFMGWTTTNIGSTGLDKTDDASEIADLDLMTSGNKSEKTGATGHYITDATVTFYAVFADYGEDGD